MLLIFLTTVYTIGTELKEKTSKELMQLADNREDAASGRGNLWDSGVVGSDRSVAVRYAGEALKPMSAIVLTLIGTSMPIIVGCTWKIPF